MKHIFTDKISRVVSAIVIMLLLAFITRCMFEVVMYNSIKHPRNEEFVIEVAFNLDIPVDSVTQEQFNARYLDED